MADAFANIVRVVVDYGVDRNVVVIATFSALDAQEVCDAILRRAVELKSAATRSRYPRARLTPWWQSTPRPRLATLRPYWETQQRP